MPPSALSAQIATAKPSVAAVRAGLVAVFAALFAEGDRIGMA